MNVVVAMDSLKGSLTSMSAGEAIREGIKRVYPGANVDVLPLADGGEGTVEALISGMGGKIQEVSVMDPLVRSVRCEYGIITESKTAVIEIAGAAGITLLSDQERNPLHTTSYGVGEVIKDAIEQGCRKFIIGIGGSATNDGGIGMLQALGYGILDAHGNQVSFGAKGLSEIEVITEENVLPQLKECEFNIACDVANVLYGEFGCSSVFGPQKGATPEMVRDMDSWMEHFAEIVKKAKANADAMKAGTGAAGGLGFAFLSFTNAVLESGIDIILKEIQLDRYIQHADIVITGEGKLDGQTVMGKAPFGVANMAKQFNKPVIAFAGMVTDDAKLCNKHGIDAYFPILRKVVSLQEAMELTNSRNNLIDTVEQVFRLFKVRNDGLISSNTI